MEKQLELSKDELDAIGFTRNHYPADENEMVIRSRIDLLFLKTNPRPPGKA